MEPKIWGMKLWFFIHTTALNFPENPTFQDKITMKDFLKI